MSENANEPSPAGTEEAREARAGEASELEPGPPSFAGDVERPDLDRRQRRIATVRKPMGPARPRAERQDEAPQPESTEGPTDPADPTS